MLNSLFRAHARGFSQAVGCCAVLLIAACGGDMGKGKLTGGGTRGVSAMSCSAASCGGSVLTMTDAKGDFLSYIVTLTSLQLQTANGTAVETVPAATKVDFSQLVDLAEVISAGQIPAGAYVSAKLTLDFTGANITADDGTGAAVTLAPQDANGNALTGTLSVSVQLDNSNHLVITPGNTGRLAFDFNLAASNMVNLAAATVQVTPTLVASVVPSDTKQVRVRGQLASVDAAGNDFVLNVQPFALHSATAGQVTTQVSATTTYQINGMPYVGMAGMTALAALPADTMVAAFGTVKTGAQPTFTATNIMAGTSLENPAEDRISGTVIARTATALTVRGVRWSSRGGDFNFERADAAVGVGANTSVTEEGQLGAFTAADISVGQHIDAFGTATQVSGGALTLDATAGQVQLDITPAWGTVTSATTGSLTLNLQSIDGLAASAFNFAGTGTSAATDAKASGYVVGTGTLSQMGLAMNEPARAFGFVTPFGMAPADFEAQALVSFAAVTADLVVSWGRAGSATAFTGLTAASTALQLDLANVADVHVIKIGPERLDLTTLATAPGIVADSTVTNGVFTIGHAGSLKTENFNNFATFVTQLSMEVTGATTVNAVAAAGQYDSAMNSFTAKRLVVLLSN